MVRASGWHNGGPPREPAGYGIKFTPADRDHHFDPEWAEVILELDGGPEVVVPLSASFWRSCSELRSADVGRWLLDGGAAPWPKQVPPHLAVRRLEGNHFSVRVLKSKSLL